MTTDMDSIGHLYRHHARQVLATLIRLLGDFAMAEEAMQEAFAAALRQWPDEGIPDNPSAWLIRAGHRKGIDQIRRKQTAQRYAHLLETEDSCLAPEELAVTDDQLRLLFTCCHPALSIDARVALTLREMCGLTTEQVASALLQKPACNCSTGSPPPKKFSTTTSTTPPAPGTSMKPWPPTSEPCPWRPRLRSSAFCNVGLTS